MFLLFLLLFAAPLIGLFYVGYKSYMREDAVIQQNQVVMEEIKDNVQKVASNINRQLPTIAGIINSISDSANKMKEIPDAIRGLSTGSQEMFTSIDLSKYVTNVPLLQLLDKYREFEYEIQYVYRVDGDPTSYDNNSFWYVLLNKVINEQMQEFYLRIGINYASKAYVANLETEYMPYMLDDTLPIVTSVLYYAKKECDADCQYDLLSQTKSLTNNVTKITLQRPKAHNVMNPFRLNDYGGLTASTQKINTIPPEFLKLAYQGKLVGRETRSYNPVQLVPKLVEFWKEDAANLLLYGGKGTGKSTLMRALMHECSSQGVCVALLSGSDLHHLKTSGFLKSVEMLTASEKSLVIFVDEFYPLAADVMAILKNFLSGSDQMERVSTVFCTNNAPEDFDESFTRVGRIEEIIQTLPFTKEEEAKLLYEYFKGTYPDKVWAPFVYSEGMTIATIAAFGRAKKLTETIM